MVLVVDKNVPQTVYLPKNFSDFGDFFDLEVYSLVSNFVYEFKNLRNQEFYNNWYCFTIDFSELPDGEYQYKLRPKDMGRLGDFNNDFSLDFWFGTEGNNDKKQKKVSYGVLQIGKYLSETAVWERGFTQKQYFPCPREPKPGTLGDFNIDFNNDFYIGSGSSPCSLTKRYPKNRYKAGPERM